MIAIAFSVASGAMITSVKMPMMGACGFGVERAGSTR